MTTDFSVSEETSSRSGESLSRGASGLPMFLVDTFFLALLLWGGSVVSPADRFPAIWGPVILWMAWSARSCPWTLRGRVSDLAVGLIALPATALLAKAGTPWEQVAWSLGVAACYVVFAAPLLHATWLKSPRTVTVLGGLVASMSLAAYLLYGRAPGIAIGTPPSRAKNLLLITIDTTRTDSLGCYGSKWDESPTLDALAASGVLFEAAIAQAPHTHSSVASLLTSTYPIEHGSLRGYYTLDPQNQTLAEDLRQNGYRTAAFLDNPWLARELGFDQGYDTFVESAETGGILAWLEAGGDSPFFLHVHLLQPHGPYDAVAPYIDEIDPDYPTGGPYAEGVPIQVLWDAREHAEAGFSAAQIDRFRALQESEVRQMDTQIAAILAGLERTGAAANTLVVVVADHGEEFQEHNSVGHAHTLYDELIHVPLLMRLPGKIPSGLRVPEQIELVDVGPTALDLLGLPPRESMRGQSYASLLTEGAPAPAESELAISQLYELRGRQLVVARTPRWKLLVSLLHTAGEGRKDVSFFFAAPDDVVWGQDVQLFDLEADPGEQIDLSWEEPEVVQELLDKLRAWRARQPYGD